MCIVYCKTIEIMKGAAAYKANNTFKKILNKLEKK
jgi:hypothetical protein